MNAQKVAAQIKKNQKAAAIAVERNVRAAFEMIISRMLRSELFGPHDFSVEDSVPYLGVKKNFEDLWIKLQHMLIENGFTAEIIDPERGERFLRINVPEIKSAHEKQFF